MQGWNTERPAHRVKSSPWTVWIQIGARPTDATFVRRVETTGKGRNMTGFEKIVHYIKIILHSPQITPHNTYQWQFYKRA